MINLPCSGFIWEYDRHLHGYCQVQLRRSQLSNKKISTDPISTSILAVCTYVRMMYDRWDDSHFLIYHPCRHLLYCKTIVVPYVDINAKVTNFFPFWTIGISMYQKRILPYIIIPYFLTPSLFPFGAFQTDRQKDRQISTPPVT